MLLVVNVFLLFLLQGYRSKQKERSVRTPTGRLICFQHLCNSVSSYLGISFSLYMYIYICGFTVVVDIVVDFQALGIV